MNTKTGPYHVVDLSPERRVMINMLNLEGPKHFMYGLLEVDVTAVRQFITDYKTQTGETLSFTGFLTLCLARAVAEDKTVQAYPKGHKQLVLFEDVNVGLMIERQIGEKRTLMGYVVQGANSKTYLRIHQEIRSVQATPVQPDRGMPTWFRLAISLPWPFSRLFNTVFRTAVRHNPTTSVAMAGTVGITSVGMFGGGHSGWGIASTIHSLDLVVGSINWKPVMVNGRIEPREILNLTVVFDHDVIDGAPATRFVRRLVELIESGYGLDSISPAQCQSAEMEKHDSREDVQLV